MSTGFEALSRSHCARSRRSDYAIRSSSRINRRRASSISFSRARGGSCRPLSVVRQQRHARVIWFGAPEKMKTRTLRGGAWWENRSAKPVIRRPSSQWLNSILSGL